MIVYSYSQGDFGTVLTNDISIEKILHLDRSGQGFRSPEISPLIELHFFPQQFAAGGDAVAADIHTRSGDQPFDLIFPLAAEGTANRLLMISCHIPAYLPFRINGYRSPYRSGQTPGLPQRS